MLSLVSIILRYKKVVILVTLAGFILSIVVSLVLPQRYVSSATFIPVGVEKKITGRQGFFARFGVFGEAYETFMRVRRNFIVEHIIRSRRMAGLMSERFNLVEVYGTREKDKVCKKLNDRTGVIVLDEGVILLDVMDRRAERARDMADFYLHGLDSFLVELTIDNARSERRVLEKEEERRQRRIIMSDSVLMAFMAEHGLYSIDKQARAALEVAAAVSSRQAVIEVEKQLLEMTMREGAPELEWLKLEIGKLGEQLLRLKEGSGDADLFPPLGELPDLIAEYIQLYTKRTMEEFALAYVRVRLEDARILENMRTSVIHVIDPPVVPERRAWPKRKQIVLFSTAATLFWVCFVLLVRQRWREGLLGVLFTGGEGGTREVGEGSGGMGSGGTGGTPHTGEGG